MRAAKKELPTSIPCFLLYEQNDYFYLVIDTTTGVNYAVYDHMTYMGENGKGGAGGQSPLYRADGELIVTPAEELKKRIDQYMNTPK